MPFPSDCQTANRAPICSMMSAAAPWPSSWYPSSITSNTWGLFINVLQAPQNILTKFAYSRNGTYENFKLKLSAWNSNLKWVFWYCIFSRDYFGEQLEVAVKFEKHSSSGQVTRHQHLSETRCVLLFLCNYYLLVHRTSVKWQSLVRQG